MQAQLVQQTHSTARGQAIVVLTILTFLILVLACAAPAFGQVFRYATIAVPVEFAVGDEVLPAGPYVVLTLSVDHALQIKNVQTGRSVFVFENDVQLSSRRTPAAAKTKLVFDSEQGHHVLRQFVIAGDDHIHELVLPERNAREPAQTSR